MKFNLKKFSLIEILIVVAIIAMLAAMLLPAVAQPYFTNNGTTGNTNQFGAYQYNQGYSAPLFPSRTIANQINDGILVGTAGPVTTVLITNAFTQAIYTQPPIVTASASITNCQVAINSVTTSNVIFQTSAVSVTVYWQAIGH